MVSDGDLVSDGAGLRDLIAVMDRLRSPGGCPWDAEQTHASLLPYAVEEVFELADVIDVVGPIDRAHLREELGDLLLQVVFHARVAQEDPDDPFDIDDVAAGIAAKLRRRHPHVFGDVQVDGAQEVVRNWEAIKAAEKPERRSPLDGVPMGMPPLEKATAFAHALRAPAASGQQGAVFTEATRGDDLAARLLALVAEADASGVDLAAAVRTRLLEVRAQIDTLVAPSPRSDDRHGGESVGQP